MKRAAPLSLPRSPSHSSAGRVNEVWSAVRGRGRSRKLMGEKSKGRAAMETDVAGRRKGAGEREPNTGKWKQQESRIRQTMALCRDKAQSHGGGVKAR